MVEYITSYQCPYCRKVYARDWEARDCRDECQPVESINSTYSFRCECCSTLYMDELQAIVCEEQHQANNDIRWQNYLVKKNFAELKKAASVPGQQRLE